MPSPCFSAWFNACFQFKLKRREEGNAREGKRPTITTKIRFAPSSSTEVLVLIGELKRKMADLGLGL